MSDSASPVLDRIVGQPAAVRLLKASLARPLHAYLFVGPPGTGRRQAAIGFAAALFCPTGGCGSCESCRAVLSERHPDLVVVERQGAAITVAQTSEVTRLAALSPRVAPYQVLVLVDFDLAGDVGASLLKTIEEPPETTVVVVTAESVPSSFVTIASRCAQVPFRRLSESDVVESLVREGTDRAGAEAVARASEGRLDRARILSADPGYATRLERWRSLPSSLDGSGATVARLATELIDALEEPLEVLRAGQSAELEHLNEQARASGERSLRGRAELEAGFRREQRRLLTDELRAGLAVLAGVYRERLAGAGAGPARARSAALAVEATALLDEAAARLRLNVNQTLLLEWLLLRLGELGSSTRAP